MKSQHKILPELSAQGIRKKPNPMLPRMFEELYSLWGTTSADRTIVDYGCGQLRHAEALLSISSRLVLVDTDYQLSTPHDFYGEKMLIADFVASRWPHASISLMSTATFAQSTINADAIFSINVLDVVPRRTRAPMIDAAVRNLAKSGYFVAIAPRNDTWTLRICTQANQYQDGHIFQHKRGYTYYRNWDGSSLHTWLSSRGLTAVKDFSRYRQMCAIFQK